MMIAMLFGIILPRIFGNNSKKMSMKEIMKLFVAIVIFLFFWGNFIQFPLSDLPACFFALFSVAILVKLVKQKINLKSMAEGVLAGVCLYIAYNIRAAFLYGLVLVILIYLAYNVKRKEFKMLIYFLPIFAGMFLSALPQMVVNRQYLGIYSPKVYTEQISGYQHDLQTQQIFWGLQYPRYETYSGNMEEYPTPQVFFIDPMGLELIDREGLSIDGFSYGMVIKLFFKYPLDISCLYIRHLIGLMTPIFSQAYITNMYAGKGIFISISIILWLILGVSLILNKPLRKERSLIYLLLGVSAVPAFLQMAGAAELRFFIEMYVVLYY